MTSNRGVWNEKATKSSWKATQDKINVQDTNLENARELYTLADSVNKL